MDSLHSELAEWQRELTRQQALLAEREAALAEGRGAKESDAVARLELELAKANEDLKQSEEENAEQLQALQDLDRQLALAKSELKHANKRAEELHASLEAQRAQAAEQHLEVIGELQRLRRALEGLAEEPNTAGHAAAADSGEGEGSGRAAELLRRATNRRAQRRPT